MQQDTVNQVLPQALSAWMDGAPLPDEVQEDAVLAWLLQDAEARAQWAEWHGVRDLLRGELVSHAATGDQSAAVGGSAWMVALHARLEQCEVGSMREDVLAGDTRSRALEPYREPSEPLVDVRGQREAANAPVWRWKWAVGFASLAVMVVTVWNVAASQWPAMLEGGRVSRGQDAAGWSQTVAAGGKVGGMQATTAASGAADQLTERQIDSLVVAHAQLGGQSMLPDLVQGGVDDGSAF